MITIHSFVFSPIQENTYVLYDETGECAIIDPGCYDESERNQLAAFIKDKKLTPVKLLNTHCHLDHVFGNKFVSEKYNLGLEINENDLTTLKSLKRVADMYGMNAEESPDPVKFLNEGDEVKFGNATFEILFTPGHSPGSICFVNKAQQFVIGGDVLFYGSIGRTDLPGGNHDKLIHNIKTKLFKLSDDFVVYSGHGRPTNIGFEKKNNPFLR